MLINIYLINSNKNKTTLKILNNNINIVININIISNYNIKKKINNINNVINLYKNYKKININFIYFINPITINKIITFLHNIFYNYKKKYNFTILNINNNCDLKLLIDKKYKQLYSNESINFINELYLFKNIVMDPNKNPNTYLKYILSRKPDIYDINIINTNDSKLFPLIKAVGQGSKFDSYFVHLFPKEKNKFNKNLFLVGKSITFDSGGLNLKKNELSDMKIDMTGSAIIISVLNLLIFNNISTNYNIHLLIPIAENMIDNTAIRPGMVIKTLSNKSVEINNTDAEGRLCLVDCFEYIINYLFENDNDIILDIATLTGNVNEITSGMSAICICNSKAINLQNNLLNISELTGEYLDKIILRNEYLDLLKSKVADIANISENSNAGCIIASAFLNFFINDKLPWIHIDIGCSSYKDNTISSYGINLLYEFIKQLD